MRAVKGERVYDGEREVSSNVAVQRGRSFVICRWKKCDNSSTTWANFHRLARLWRGLAAKLATTSVRAHFRCSLIYSLAFVVTSVHALSMAALGVKVLQLTLLENEVRLLIINVLKESIKTISYLICVLLFFLSANILMPFKRNTRVLLSRNHRFPQNELPWPPSSLNTTTKNTISSPKLSRLDFPLQHAGTPITLVFLFFLVAVSSAQ